MESLLLNWDFVIPFVRDLFSFILFSLISSIYPSFVSEDMPLSSVDSSWDFISPVIVALCEFLFLALGISFSEYLSIKKPYFKSYVVRLEWISIVTLWLPSLCVDDIRISLYEERDNLFNARGVPESKVVLLGIGSLPAAGSSIYIL